MKTKIKKWEKLTNEITEGWIEKYFEVDVFEEVIEVDWVGGEIGGVFLYGDYYVSFSDVLTCFNLNIEPTKFFQWYDNTLEQYSVGVNTMNLKNFIEFPQESLKQREAYLKVLEDRVKEAEETLKKAIEEHNV